MKVKIRAAGHEDVEAVFRFTMDAYLADFERGHFPPPDPEKVWAMVQHVLANGRIYIAETPSEIVGQIGGVPNELYFSRTAYVQDMGFLVKEEYRASRIAIALLRALKNYAHSLDMRLVLSVTSGTDLERKDKFFQRNGMRRLGSVYEG